MIRIGEERIRGGKERSGENRNGVRGKRDDTDDGQRGGHTHNLTFSLPLHADVRVDT